ncbi:DUF2004 domain-containing protein [Phormidium sp. FACHB-592]|uniref:DUF2004 domain-containing protein n=1 Tax=Stenomitos frigidus AS-A4 TaxID=2933935 RepID=A0ABV0KRU9_9CYAN|nr:MULTISPECIES: DUF2004 domain-containing protein [Cyanophyceae]MBD2037721.1 DUF2004 domain-containing protein [Leptolyngbya sp. FACHB-321]MBD2074200.1 DUF2004 domain-containing protein [Phormidium sp. FACHB-592]
MSKVKKESERRTALALAAIKRLFDDGNGNSGVSLFASHQLEERDAAYWKKHAGTPRSSVKQVVDGLKLCSHWGDEDEGSINTFDFTLPAEATDCLLSVRFDEDGEGEDISLES